ncbi:MAG: hypothetical protein H6Q15_895 [Bacteroidetes bacterium]|nr:hypothetical protein [Bacteroidota bacterium]
MIEKIVKLPDYFLFTKPHLDLFISVLRKIYTTKSNEIILDFSGILDMNESDLMILFAQIEKTGYDKKVIFKKRPTLPKARKPNNILSNKIGVFHNSTTNFNSESVEKYADINTEIVDKIVLELKRIGIKDYYSAFYTFLIELIGNATEHGIENRQINWWLINKIDNKTKQINYVFVDMGSGIIGSHKKVGLPFKYYFTSATKILTDAFKGKLRSSTKIDNRGKGLPQLFGFIKNDVVSNFTITTNTVTMHFENDLLVTSKNKNFIGTYYSWSINNDNYIKWKNSKLK